MFTFVYIRPPVFNHITIIDPPTTTRIANTSSLPTQSRSLQLLDPLLDIRDSPKLQIDIFLLTVHVSARMHMQGTNEKSKTNQEDEKKKDNKRNGKSDNGGRGMTYSSSTALLSASKPPK